jgi:Plasmid pRiA4b ORF-3-like protein
MALDRGRDGPCDPSAGRRPRPVNLGPLDLRVRAPSLSAGDKIAMAFESNGVCELCLEQTSKAAMIQHLRRCVVEHDRTKGMASDLFQLRVESKDTPLFWLDVEVKGESPIRRLDDLLRRTWLECCGHLSAFETLGLRYVVVVDKEFRGGPPERSMNVKVAEVLSFIGQELSYEYDYGSTTELTLHFVSARRGNVGRSAARLLARNAPPVWTCAVCEAPATLVCPFCMDDGNPFVCRVHGSEHACGNDESFLPVVNSPRMGVCGYTGEV